MKDALNLVPIFMITLDLTLTFNVGVDSGVDVCLGVGDSICLSYDDYVINQSNTLLGLCIICQRNGSKNTNGCRRGSCVEVRTCSEASKCQLNTSYYLRTLTIREKYDTLI